MQDEAQVRVTPQLAIGVFIMAAGILLALDEFELISIGSTWRLWPGVLVVIGTLILANKRDTHSRFWGSVWIGLGVWLLLNTLGLLRVAVWDMLWPAILILIGLKLVTQKTKRRSESEAKAGTSQFAIFAESNRSSNDDPYTGGEMTAILGGCRLDLRQAVIPPGGVATVDAFTVMGGLEIWVPTGWTVVLDVVPFMGGVEDKRLVAAPGGPVPPVTPPKLIVRGYVVLGALTLKN